MPRLPWELEEEILTRLPPKFLVRFRTVCKQWNSLFNDRSFIYNHLSLPRPQFILLTKYTIYSIDITDPTMKLLERHTSRLGLRYDNSRPEKVYKMLGYMRCPSKVQTNSYLQRVSMEVVDNVYKMLGYFRSPPEDQINVYPDRVVICECAFQTLRFIDTPDEDMPMSETAKSSHVSLNGNLYWIACNRQTREYFIQSSDFSSEIFKPVCLLSFQESPSCDEHVLAVFKGDRFSLLMQCYLTRKIEIWVTKRKIDDTEEMVWMKLMTLTATNLPKLFNKLYGVSYFIYDKTLVMCCGDDESGKPCIYIVKGDTCNKIHIGADLNSLASRITWFSHCAYVPNWTSVPLEF
ncbi:hypothetical protein DY000_02050240 [Brassica cretica]|uniref:F-box domain-containing protein n=1 Tax=Brassica cretica TaxID=69181 RepID=A0ABQ7ETU9_BRACR|nr:hypothetical protein DY000_02050240 [Brassica cretica]